MNYVRQNPPRNVWKMPHWYERSVDILVWAMAISLLPLTVWAIWMIFHN